MKRLYFLLTVVIASLTVNAAQVIDRLIPETFATAAFSQKTMEGTTESGNVYQFFGSGYFYGARKYFSVNSFSVPAGFVTVQAVGVCKKVSMECNASTGSPRTLNIYGSHSPFTLQDMYDGTNCELIGTLVRQPGVTTDATELSGDYEYIGMRPADGLMYIYEITFEWDTNPNGPAEPEVTLTEGVGGTLRATTTDEEGNVVKVESGDVMEEGQEVVFDVKANDAYVIESLTVSGLNVAPATHRTHYELTMTATLGVPLNVEATFAPLKVASATVTYSAGKGGTIAAVDATGFVPVKTGDKVTTPHVVSFAAKADAGYIVDHFTVNGEDVAPEVPEQEMTNLMIPIIEDTEVTVTFTPTVSYCNNYEGLQQTGSDNGARYLGSLTLSCGNASLKLSNLQNSGKSDVYLDNTDKVLEIEPGQTVTVQTGDSNNSWMHGYVWVDWNRDAEFTAEMSGHAVTADSELVAFTYYDGYNSTGSYMGTKNNGSAAANGYKANLTFNVPADLAPGDYRLRYIVAWDNINPCGPELSDKDRLDGTGGCILDVTLRYGEAESSDEATVTFSAGKGGTIECVDATDFVLVKIGQTVSVPRVLSFVATPDPGYVVDHFTVNGEDVAPEVPEQEMTNLMMTIVEDTNVEVTFTQVGRYCNNYEGMTNNHSGRYVNAVTLTCGDKTLTVSGLQTINSKSDIYFDKTDEILAITPGSSINFKVTQSGGSWMHGYVWVDWNRDFDFTPEIKDHAVTANSELVAYNFYTDVWDSSANDGKGDWSENGYDSKGNAVNNQANGYQSNFTFMTPADLAPGDYRMRFIISWNNIDPCGPELSDKDRLDGTGGIILDLTLRCAKSNLAPSTGIETIEAAEDNAPAVYYNLQGLRVDNPSTGVYIRVARSKAEKVRL